MSRGVSAVGISREVLPDPIYGSKILSKLINRVMQDGKKSVARKIVYGAIDDISDKIFELYNQNNPEKNESTDKQKVLWFAEYIISEVAMMVEIRSKRMGGSNYRIPVPVSVKRAVSIAIRRIVIGAQKRKEKTMQSKLSSELISIVNGTGEVIKMKEHLQKDIEANRAFAHFANR